jgi:hypothetical protein
MIELDLPDEIPAAKRAISPVVFYGAAGLGAFALTLLAVSFLGRLGLSEIQRPFSGVLLIVLVSAAFGLCVATADRLLKGRGLSRSCVLTEDVNRLPDTESPAAANLGEAIEFPLSDRGNFGPSPLFFLLFGPMFMAGNADWNPASIAGVLLAGLVFGLVGFALRNALPPGRLMILIDERGINGPTMKAPSQASHVPWGCVASCSIVTTSDPTGSFRSVGPILKGRRGGILMRLNLDSLPKPERERALEAIRAHFPRSRFDPLAKVGDPVAPRPRPVPPAGGDAFPMAGAGWIYPAANEAGVIESPSDVALFAVLSWAFSGAAILALVALWGAYSFLSPDRLTPKLWGEVAGFLAVAAVAGLAALVCRRQRRKGLVQVDASGITGPSMNSPFRHAFVPWKSIASCEVVTAVDLGGETVPLLRVLKDARGATLLEIDLRKIPRSARERLAESLRERLPKTDLDPWDELA